MKPSAIKKPSTVLLYAAKFIEQNKDATIGACVATALARKWLWGEGWSEHYIESLRAERRADAIMSELFEADARTDLEFEESPPHYWLGPLDEEHRGIRILACLFASLVAKDRGE